MNTLFVYCAAAIMVGINGNYLGAKHEGVKTVFETVDLDANNNCEWEKSRPMTDHSVFPYGMYTAVDTELFDDGISCGECYELKCVKPIDTWGKCSCVDGASVTVMIVDWGHDAALPYTEVFDSQGHVAREILSGDCLNDGSKYEITYQQVCCDHQENIKVYNYEGTTRFWLSFVVAEVRGYGSITNFYMRENGRSNWFECNRDTNSINANFVCDPWEDDFTKYKDEGIADGLVLGEGEEEYHLPIDIKIIDSNGQTLVSEGLITNRLIEHEFDFGSNFNSEACDGTTTTTTTTTTTLTPKPTTTTTTTTTPKPTTTTTTTTTPKPTTTTTTTVRPTTPKPTTTTTTTTTPKPTTTTTTVRPTTPKPTTTTTTTTTPKPTTTTTTTTTPKPTTTTTTKTECPEGALGQECTDNSQCPTCMKCCPEKHVCEMLDATPKAQAISMMNDINHKPIVNKPKATNDPNMFGYILLVGLIAFILINNLFIGCWCLNKRNGNKNKEQYEVYEKCDIVALNSD